MMKDLKNQKIRKLKVLYQVKRVTPKKELSWMCECECGTFKIFTSGQLRSVQSCSKSCSSTKNRKADCHPDLPHEGRGLCVSCYSKWRKESSVVKAKCHPDRPHKGKGLCLSCYDKQPHRRKLQQDNCKAWYANKPIEYHNKRVMNWINNNYSKYLRTQRKSNNKRRLLKISQDDGSVTSEFLEELLNQTLCYYCREFVPEEKRTIEHLQPISRKGLHSASNIVMACRTCNARKKEKTEAEFLAWKEKNRVKKCN